LSDRSSEVTSFGGGGCCWNGKMRLFSRPLLWVVKRGPGPGTGPHWPISAGGPSALTACTMRVIRHPPSPMSSTLPSNRWPPSSLPAFARSSESDLARDLCSALPVCTPCVHSISCSRLLLPHDSLPWPRAMDTLPPNTAKVNTWVAQQGSPPKQAFESMGRLDDFFCGLQSA